MWIPNLHPKQQHLIKLQPGIKVQHWIKSIKLYHMYLECFDLILESLVLTLQILHTMLGLAQLHFQLSLQLPAPLLKLQQLLLSLLVAVSRHKTRHQTTAGDRRLGDTVGGRWSPVLQTFCLHTVYPDNNSGLTSFSVSRKSNKWINDNV